MPSPFPGMDPFIEARSWQDFHTGMIAEIRASLVPYLRPRYAVRIKERIYLEHETNERSRHIQPDLTIAQTSDLGVERVRGSSAVAAEPINITLPAPEEVKQRYLTIQDMETLNVVTIIEVLSPANKRRCSYDRAMYQSKCDEALRSETNLVEIDLLRGGERIAAEPSLESADYCAIVSRAGSWPKAIAYPWSLRQHMPSIPIPLASGDDDVPLDIQAAFTTAYDRAGYDYSINYSRAVEPQLSDTDAGWVAEILASHTG